MSPPERLPTPYKEAFLTDIEAAGDERLTTPNAHVVDVDETQAKAGGVGP